MTWQLFDQGRTFGREGSEGGRIIEDDEYQSMARMTLEADCQRVPYAVTCGIYGWMVHTKFFKGLEEARVQMEHMKSKLASIVDSIPLEDEASDEDDRRINMEIAEFVSQFP